MRNTVFRGLGWLVCLAPLHAWAAVSAPQWSVSFDQHAPAPYDETLVREDWKSVEWCGIAGRASIWQAADNPAQHFLRVRYPAKTVGPEHNGGQFMVNLPPSDEYYLSYRVRFQPGFDFVKGGKLPGLASGGGKYSNGHKPYAGDGWTARLMWVEKGRLVPYLYYVGMPKERKYGDFWTIDAQVTPGQWQQITQQVRLNTPGKKDGIYTVWINGELVTRRTDMEWRRGLRGRVDTFYFSTYHGGNSPDWAPRWNCFVDFDDFRISTRPPANVRKTSISH